MQMTIVMNSGQRGYVPNIFLKPMEFSIKFDIVKSGGSTDYIEGLQVIISPKVLHFFL